MLSRPPVRAHTKNARTSPLSHAWPVPLILRSWSRPAGGGPTEAPPVRLPGALGPFPGRATGRVSSTCDRDREKGGAPCMPRSLHRARRHRTDLPTGTPRSRLRWRFRVRQSLPPRLPRAQTSRQSQRQHRCWSTDRDASRRSPHVLGSAVTWSHPHENYASCGRAGANTRPAVGGYPLYRWV
jgi:hypothetical protein